MDAAIELGKCPNCTTADLTYGRKLCHAWAVVRSLYGTAPVEREAG